MESSHVTIDKVYFETLLRRAQFYTAGSEEHSPPLKLELETEIVSIPKADHDSLLSSARQYANLRRNLFRGGIAEATLAALISDDYPETDVSTSFLTLEETSTSRTILTGQSPQKLDTSIGNGQDYTYGRNASYTPRSSDLQPREGNGFFQNRLHKDDVTSPEDIFSDMGYGNNNFQSKTNRPKFDKLGQRTILLINLPENTTHAEITDAIRGGMLVDVYLRSNDRSASVSFLHEANAQNFFRHVKRHDLYIRRKRVDIRWNDRQYELHGHVANKIGAGATRNLVIYGRPLNFTEEMIRNELEHIHNLVVIKVSLKDKDAYISTNSVHNAMYARTCLMSRSIYKGSKIEWDVDACAGPLVTPTPQSFKGNSLKKKASLPVNRFAPLNVDNENDSQDDNDTSISKNLIQAAIV